MSGLLSSQMVRKDGGAFRVSKSGKGYTIWSRRAKRNRSFSRGNNVRLLCVRVASELPPRLVNHDNQEAACQRESQQ